MSGELALVEELQSALQQRDRLVLDRMSVGEVAVELVI
jgi:hypothetical protein